VKLILETVMEEGGLVEREEIDYRTEILKRASEPNNQVLGAIGLCGEAGEYADLIKKDVFHDVPASLEKIKKELGDVLWYLVYSADAAGLSIEEIALENVKKLRARYPEGFTPGGGIR
jgi:NTP pyrophosphatase (non-canonical NTP hydrolase)